MSEPLARRRSATCPMGAPSWGGGSRSEPVDQPTPAGRPNPHRLGRSDTHSMPQESLRATLALEDGIVFRGKAFGRIGETSGEVVFNTSLCGYQEVLTDPSYRGQLVTMTYPHIGNYGVNRDDVESSRPQVAGFIVREISTSASSWRASGELNPYREEAGVVGLSEIDTRMLTRRLRTHGAKRGVISSIDHDAESLIAKA